MDTDRFPDFERVDAILRRALEVPPETREAWLGRACEGDPELLARVRELLALASDDACTLATGSASRAMLEGGKTPTGERFGPWRILERIGRGGMADVYLAERADGAYQQHVAVKLLHRSWHTAAIEQRFERERSLLARLEHPNIARLLDGGTIEDGRSYLVMELVEGETIDRFCDSKRLSIRERLEIFLAVCDAVQFAHRQLIVHRDIKPGNILVNSSGVPKLLDFGIAKLLEPDPKRVDLTRTGLADRLLTPQYASPEQVLGEPVSTATDVHALGLLLYELLCGRRARTFDATRPSEIEKAICERQPAPPSQACRDGAESSSEDERPLAERAAARGLSISQLRRTLRGDLDNIVMMALRREPERRYATAEQLADDVRNFLATRPVRARPDSTAYRLDRFVRRHAFGVAASGVTLLLAAAVIVLLQTSIAWRESTPPRIERVVKLTSLAGVEDTPAWSPDGQAIAYTSDARGNLDIFVQNPLGTPARRLTESGADDAQPAWSPDGEWIAFVSARNRSDRRLRMHPDLGPWTAFFAGGNGDIWIMPSAGGEARMIARNGYFPAWSPDGQSLLYQVEHEGRWEFRITDVRSPEQPRTLELREYPTALVRTQPAWSPDGRWIAFIGGLGDDLGLYVVSSEGGIPRELVPPTALTPSWSPDGRWIYFSSTRGGSMNLWRARFEQGRLTGIPQPLTTSRGEDLFARSAPSGGQLVYSSLRRSMNIWQLELDSGDSQVVFRESALQDHARPSPDGDRLAFSSDRRGEQNLWILDRGLGSLIRVTQDPATRSAWTPDGKKLLYLMTGKVVEFDVANRQSRTIFAGPVFPFGGLSITLDGEQAVLNLRRGGMGSPIELIRLDLAAGRTSPVSLAINEAVFDPALSPDGERLAVYTQVGPRGRAIWNAPLSGPDQAIQLTDGDHEDSHPAWSADGREIYFVRNHQNLFSVDASGGTARPITRYQSFSTAVEYPAASADGKSLLFSRVDRSGDIYLLDLEGSTAQN